MIQIRKVKFDGIKRQGFCYYAFWRNTAFGIEIPFTFRRKNNELN